MFWKKHDKRGGGAKGEEVVVGKGGTKVKWKGERKRKEGVGG